MNKTTKKDSGFTIIEVVLVLAIAALIMLLVFLALPALQRSQRDTQRKNDVSRLQSAISNYKARNRGKLPDKDGWKLFFAQEMRLAKKIQDQGSDTFADPAGENYNPVVRTVDTQETWSGGDNNIYLYYGAKCDGETVTGTSGTDTARRIVIVKTLEGGGRQCQEA